MSKSFKTIIFDVDGVIVDLVTPILDSLNEKFNSTLIKKDIHTFNFMKVANKILTEPEADEAKRMFSTRGFVTSLPEIPGAVEVVREIISHSDTEVLFVTSQWNDSETWCFERYNWLKDRFGKDIKVIFTHDKKYIKADVLIDDAVHNCHAYKLENPNSKVILMRQPWNDKEANENPKEFCDSFISENTFEELIGTLTR